MPRYRKLENRKYKEEWTKIPEFSSWLEKSKFDDDKAWCRLCQCQINPKISHLRGHVSSKKHSSKISGAKGTRPIEKTFTQFTKDLERRRFELRLSLHTALKSSFRSMDSLSEIIKDETKNDIKLHRTKCMNLVRQVLGPFFKKELKQDLIDTPFSIGIDETTDVSVKKQMSFTVRYYSKRFSTIKETFLGMVEIEGGDANTLTSCVQEVLADWNLIGSFFVGLGTDGASPMIGKHHSVAALLKKGYPHLQSIRCVCHSIDLAGKDFMKVLPMHLTYMIRESYNWFAHSTERQRAYKEILNIVGFASIHDLFNEDPASETEGKRALKLISPSNTRWLVLADCMERIVQQYDALSTHFELAASKDRDCAANILSGYFKDESNKIWFIFVLPILKELRRLTKLFEKKSADNFTIYKEICTYFVSLGQRILKPAILSRNTTAQLCELELDTDYCFLSLDDADLGYQFLTKVKNLRVSETQKLNMRQRAFNSLKSLFHGIQKRMSNTIEIFEDMEPFSLPNFIEKAPDSKCFKGLYFDTNKVRNGIIEQKVRQLRNEAKEGESTEQFWCRCHEMNVGGEYKYRDVTDGVIRMLCLPIANAEVERTFSGVTNTKSDEKSQMKNDLLEAILYCKFGLQWMEKNVEDFVPPLNIVKFDSSIYQ